MSTKIDRLHNLALKNRHEMTLQTWSGDYQRWRCRLCGAELIIHDATAAEMRVDGSATAETCAHPARRTPDLTPLKLFNDAASDDWGDSKAQRTGQTRLL